MNDLNTARNVGYGVGTDNTSALAFGGNPNSKATESWNGTNWTEINDMNTAIYDNGGGGVQTSAVSFGGRNPAIPVSNSAGTETWNGTNWTNAQNMNVGRQGLAGAGTSNTSAIAFGGAPNSAATEEWTVRS